MGGINDRTRLGEEFTCSQYLCVGQDVVGDHHSAIVLSANSKE